MDYDRIEWKEGLRRLQEAQTEIVKLRQSLAAAEAREAKLREVLQRLQSYHYNPFEPGNQSVAYRLIFDTLADPAHDTALRERLARERERIAEYVDRNLMSCREYADYIRSMGDE